MIDIQKYIIKAMKKEMFNNTEEQNKAARQVLAEIKTKYVDIREQITTELQYKLIKKLADERRTSIETYINANRKDLADKENNELNVIQQLLKELEQELPQQLNDEEIINIIKNNDFKNIGECMKWFKQNYPMQDKKQISLIFNNMVKR